MIPSVALAAMDVSAKDVWGCGREFLGESSTNICELALELSLCTLGRSRREPLLLSGGVRKSS